MYLLVLTPFSTSATMEEAQQAFKDKNFKQAFELMQPYAEQGNADAQTYLGIMYDNSKGVLKKEKKAVKWYRKAAKQGNVDAQLFLSYMYLDGTGVVKNLSKVSYWTKKAYENPKASDTQEKLAKWLWDDFKLWKY